MIGSKKRNVHVFVVAQVCLAQRGKRVDETQESVETNNMTKTAVHIIVSLAAVVERGEREGAINHQPLEQGEAPHFQVHAVNDQQLPPLYGNSEGGHVRYSSQSKLEKMNLPLPTLMLKSGSTSFSDPSPPGSRTFGVPCPGKTTSLLCDKRSGLVVSIAGGGRAATSPVLRGSWGCECLRRCCCCCCIWGIENASDFCSSSSSALAQNKQKKVTAAECLFVLTPRRRKAASLPVMFISTS